MEIQQPDMFRRHTAYHESGHAIADLVFEYCFTFVTIKPDESGEDDGGVCGNTKGRARDLAVIQRAGIVASAKMMGCDPWEYPYLSENNSTDIATARNFIDTWVAFLSKTYGESSYRQQIGDDIKNKPRLLADQNRKPIDGIADVLPEKESLTLDDVTRILKAQCPDFITREKP
jgi:ATP-dependent Zn protease